MVEDESLQDEPPSGDPNAIDENDYFYLNHIYTNNLPETRDLLRDLWIHIKFYAQQAYGREIFSMTEVC